MRAAARAMRDVDDRVPGHLELLKEIFPHTGRAFVVGVTGNPGAGKSTLTDRLIERYRARGQARSASSASIRRARTPAARSSAIASA